MSKPSYEDHRKVMLHKMSNGDVLEGIEIHALRTIEKHQGLLEDVTPTDVAKIANYQEAIRQARSLLKIRGELEDYIAKINLSKIA